MARIILPLAAVAALAPFASAAPSFTSPKAGDTLTAGTAIEVKWDDSSDSPKIADLLSYQLFLCAGGNKEGEFVSAHLLRQLSGNTRGPGLATLKEHTD
jgi:hypothetical protein